MKPANQPLSRTPGAVATQLLVHGFATLILVATIVMAAGQSRGGERRATTAPPAASTAPIDEYGRQIILGGRRGTLMELKRLNLHNLAEGALPQGEVTIDAAPLRHTEHFTRSSHPLHLEPEKDYTLLVEVRGEGEGYISVGIRWNRPDAPPGVVDQEVFLTVLKSPCDWTERSFTFTSDPDPNAGEAQVLLKAYGGVKAAFRNLRVVEGWFADTPLSFNRPYRAGERKW